MIGPGGMMPGMPGLPGQQPGAMPGQQPGAMPGQQPGAMPGQQPGAMPGQQPGMPMQPGITMNIMFWQQVIFTAYFVHFKC